MTNQTNDTHSTQEQVSAICNKLVAEGTKPTVRLVLSELPTVKSTSTVHRYFKEWKDELDANQQSLYDKLGFSAEFSTSFMKEITRFSVEAEQRYKNLAADASEQRDVAINALENVEERYHKQIAVIEQKEKQLKSLKDEVTEIRHDMQAELSKAKEVNDATVSELREQLKKAMDENKTLLSANEEIRTRQVKAELKLEGYQELVDEVKAQNNQLLRDNKELNATLAELGRTIASLESTVTGNEKLIEQLRK